MLRKGAGKMRWEQAPTLRKEKRMRGRSNPGYGKRGSIYNFLYCRVAACCHRNKNLNKGGGDYFPAQKGNEKSTAKPCF